MVQLMIKLINLELKDDDPLALASKIRAIVHGVEAIGFKMEILVIAFVKAVYPTFSQYFESLQASGQLKDITFDTLVENFAR